MNLAGRFTIDGYDLYEAFKVVVQEAQGLDVLPKVKKRTEYDWQEESGVDVDATTDLTYEAHDITLDCYVKESTYADAVKRINGVVKLLSSDGFHLLGSQLRQRLYPVLLQEVTGYKRITPAISSSIYVQFTLKLRCPMPETRIGNVTVEADEEVTLVIPTDKDFTVWWGDGTVNENTLTHTYTEAGTYTVLIAGTGVTSVVITGINVAEFSYPATGDITHVDVSHTSEEAYQRAVSIESGLKSDSNGGSIPAAIYTWFKGLFTALVEGSVKSYIIGLLTVVKDLAVRVGLLEDKLVLEYIVPVDTFSVVITQDKNGNPLNLSGEFEISRLSPFGNNIISTGVASLFINNITGNIYKQTYENGILNAVNTRGGAYYSHSRFDIIVNNGIMSWHLKNWLTDGELTYPSVYNAAGHSMKSLQIINSITKLEFKDSASGVYKLIKAGTIITIRRK